MKALLLIAAFWFVVALYFGTVHFVRRRIDGHGIPNGPLLGVVQPPDSKESL